MSDQPGAAPGYPSMPAETPPSPVARGPAPSTVSSATLLMLIRAGLGVLGIIVVLATKNTLKQEIFKKNPTVDAARLDTLLNAAVVIGVVVGLVFIVLYVLLAFQVRKGKNWARIVTWVFAGLGILSALGSLAQPEPALSRAVTLLSAVLDIAIIVLLVQRTSNQYFRSPSP